ncbi:MAG: transporter substrate-binding domain-containing protein [Acutalibacteraceae bacterium]|nr:transporter substrate-binding domain-containing protein [Acutalibacteraceae bacterium]MEE3373641.1 transporter substrate-binding domain-containing protein [Acutalibacteraceae bacterium]NLD29821.1 transporter substrate-binding domain-containing protein [Clostridiales bacterium]
MKKLISVILAAMMVVLLAACGGGSKSGGAQYVFLEEEMGTESYAIGFKKGNEDLAKTVTGAVYALVKDGTYAKIGEKYPDIKDYLSLKAEDINDADIPAKGSGDPNFTFKHGFDLDYPPYSYLKDDGSVGGFDVELCQAVCEYMGWKYESVPFNWEAKDMELNAGSCDCIWSGFTKEGREDKYTWGCTYSNNVQGILVASDSGITTLADLAGKTVGVQIDTSAAEMLEDSKKELADTFGELKTYETYTVAFNDLKAGAIDAIAIDMTAGAYLISNEAAK